MTQVRDGRGARLTDGKSVPLCAVLYRVAAVLIVVFWAAMTVLLVRSEIEPGGSRMRDVPVAHVLRQLFLHQQPSELSIQFQKTAVGRLRVHPQVRSEDGTRILDLVGHAQFSLPGLPSERVSWDGSFEFTPGLEWRRVRVGVTTRGPDRYRLEVDHDVVAGQGRYQLKSGDVVVRASPYSLDPAGRAMLLQQANLSPPMIAMIEGAVQSSGGQEAVMLAARQATLSFQGEQIETSLVTLRQGIQKLLEIHISQLGQVLQADSMLGYSLSAE